MSVSNSLSQVVGAQAKTRFFDNSLMVANTPILILAPASNVSGCLISYAVVTSNSGSAVFSCLCIGTSAPANALSGHIILLAVKDSAGMASAQLSKEIFLPPGVGIWSVSSIAETTAQRSIGYTLL